MKVIILDSLFRQSDRNYDLDIPKEVLPRLFKEFQRLEELERSGQNSVEEYIKNHHGIKMKGADKIFKYELTDGDRMLYTRSIYLPWLSYRVENSIVLLRYSKHDDQGDAARKFDLKKERGYKYLKKIVEEMSDLEIDAVNNSDISMEDYVALAEILNSDDYTAWHKAYVIEDDLDYAALTLDEMEVLLSNEQGECVAEFFEKPRPTLIIGGAGTGKTLIAVHMLINYARDNRQKKAFYFTQSAELRNKVVALYKQYGEIGETDNVEFQDINEYCIKQLSLKHTNIVCTREFLSFVENTPSVQEMCRKNDLSPIVVWTEIRGLIKGGMSAEWTRAGSMAQNRFSGSIKSLIDREYFVRAEEDKKRILLANSSVAKTKEKMALDMDISPDDKENLNRAISYFSGFDPHVRVLSKSDYMNVSAELSSVEMDKRPVVWDICQLYDDYLKNNSLYDENDLVRMMFEKDICSEPKCDFSIVDEVQDYTELQLFLIKTLTKGNQIVFAGDEHQNINPASFSESRIKSLFYQEKNVELRIRRLQKNFRCQQGIIDVTNALARLRKKAIGSGSLLNEKPEEAIRQSEALPNRLVFSEENLASCLCELLPYPKAVFLVPDQATRTVLLEKINRLKDTITDRIGVDKFNARLKSAVFTVAEIKGVEYEYVVCFDLIGSNIDTWQRILSGVRHQTKYRYYFNLLYVAMTRAQEYLCIIDTDLSEELDNKMGIRTVELFDAEKLYCNKLGASEADWYEQARELEKNGKYREALEMYKAANAESSCINRCNYYISIEEKDFDAAISNAIALDSPELIDGYWEDIEDADLKRLAEAYVVLKTDPNNYEFRHTNISMLIQSKIPEDIQPDVRTVILHTLNDALKKHITELGSVTENKAEKARREGIETDHSPEEKTEKAKSDNKGNGSEADERSCYNCKLYKNGTCSGLNGPCNDYQHSPIITEEEKKTWPTEMGPYVTGYGPRGKW